MLARKCNTSEHPLYWRLHTYLYLWTLFTWHASSVVGSLTRSFDLWWSMGWVRTHLLSELWLWLVSCPFPCFLWIRVLWVDACKLIISKPRLKPGVISSAGWCCCCSVFVGVALKTTSPLSFCLLSNSTWGKMSKIISKENEEICRRLFWCEILSYL